ncbi:type IV secretion system protein VirB9 [Enhydrobacter aerosaccus]|uniref:Type IV secretion system protein VirB9 n=1 Tax=Enhydrobacter aerosaccus TaxID=225324 RepID=A0A1T4TIU1_9HYPH|nr:TrbG/VirB9 family P-type conjugative transfer protein [Enhydrobacter aerosaccus]SKA40416.1 type IV secretion system protein VirB9 [Enhydrobacter aerosaccus]
MKKGVILAAVSAFALAAPATVSWRAYANETPRSGALDSRVRYVNYNEWQVYTITTSLRWVQTIEIASDETIRNVAMGDTVSWEVAPTGNILFVKQREEAKRTNAVVTAVTPDGSLRTYQFEFQSEAGEPSMVKVKFLYPGVEAAKKKAEAEKERQANFGAAMATQAFSGTLNYRYTLTGTANYAPTDAWDNGQVTAFRFAGQTEIPSIYAVDGAGEERIVQVNMQGDVAVLGTVAAAWRLRIGPQVICIYNEAYAPAAAPRGNGTVGEGYVRQIKIGSDQ